MNDFVLRAFLSALLANPSNPCSIMSDTHGNSVSTFVGKVPLLTANVLREQQRRHNHIFKAFFQSSYENCAQICRVAADEDRDSCVWRLVKTSSDGPISDDDLREVLMMIVAALEEGGFAVRINHETRELAITWKEGVNRTCHGKLYLEAKRSSEQARLSLENDGIETRTAFLEKGVGSHKRITGAIQETSRAIHQNAQAFSGRHQGNPPM